MQDEFDFFSRRRYFHPTEAWERAWRRNVCCPSANLLVDRFKGDFFSDESAAIGLLRSVFSVAFVDSRTSFVTFRHHFFQPGVLDLLRPLKIDVKPRKVTHFFETQLAEDLHQYMPLCFIEA